jgi:type IX secretion system PorP/SprF family membrane protein
MNRTAFVILAFILVLPLSGQMFPLSDHYELNGLAINPAFAGCHDALSATIMYRNQWPGFKDAPKSYILSLHTPIENDRMGLGLLIKKNSIGIYNESNITGNYAYRRELYNGKLALGLGFGVTVYNIAWDDLIANDINDPQLLNNPTSATLPDFSLGAYYYTRKYYIGLSIPFLLSHELNHTSGRYNTKNNFSDYNYFITGGYQIMISPQVKILPSIIIKYHPNNALQIDYNTQVSLIDRIWMGIGYRNKNMLIGILQIQLNYQLRMAYSYDFDFGGLAKYRNGSHEVGFNYQFSFARKVTGPR